MMKNHEKSAALSAALQTINNEHQVAAFLQADLTAWIAGRLGLHFPPERQPEIARMLSLGAQKFGFADALACAQWLLSSAPTDEQMGILAGYLTVGETYFFREREVFDQLETTILPALLRGHCGAAQRLRIWCAACASGEEAYSLAILLDQCLPQRAQWDVTILATDVNAAALQKARQGIYREWSFRQAPPGFKERYFKPLNPGEFEIAAHLKEMVQFVELNLAAQTYPARLTPAGGMDLILCRNVLMYFTPLQALQTAARLYQALHPAGWLITGQAELSASIFGAFQPLHLGDTVAYRRQEGTEDSILKWQLKRAAAARFGETTGLADGVEPGGMALIPEPAVPGSPRLAAAEPVEVRAAFQPSPAAGAAADLWAGLKTQPAQALVGEALVRQALVRQALVGQALGRQIGRAAQPLAAAVEECQQALASNPLDPALHYQLAALSIEQGAEEKAIQALRNALFLAPDFVMAYVSWGELAERAGRPDEAARHFANAVRLLQALPLTETVAASAGQTARNLLETLRRKAAAREMGSHA